MAFYWSFSSGVGVNFAHSSMLMESKGRYLKKSPKPCWPIKSKETWIKYALLAQISQRKLAFNREKYTFCVVKSLAHIKNVKTGGVPYLGLELTMHRTECLRFSRPQPGCHWSNSPWTGIIKFFPSRGSSVSNIQAGDGKAVNLFYSVHVLKSQIHLVRQSL